MKIFLRIIFAAILIFVGLKFLLPHKHYPIEHFEQAIISIIPFSWKFIAIFSRFLVGLLFILAFLLLFYWQKIKWTKYIAIFMISIPFIINPIFPKNLKDESVTVNENLGFNLNNSEEETLLVYVSPNCLHCKEAMIKIDVAKHKSAHFKKIKVLSYNDEIQEFIDENQLSLELEVISAESFLERTKGSFPKFELVKNRIVIKKWSNPQFNYAVLDNLYH